MGLNSTHEIVEAPRTVGVCVCVMAQLFDCPSKVLTMGATAVEDAEFLLFHIPQRNIS